MSEMSKNATTTANPYLGWLLHASAQMAQFIGAGPLVGTFRQWSQYDLPAANAAAGRIGLYMRGRVDGLPGSASIYYVPGLERLPLQGNQPSWQGGLHLQCQVLVDRVLEDYPALQDALIVFPHNSWLLDHGKRADGPAGFIQATLVYVAAWRAATELARQETTWLDEVAGRVDYGPAMAAARELVVSVVERVLPPLPGQPSLGILRRLSDSPAEERERLLAAVGTSEALDSYAEYEEVLSFNVRAIEGFLRLLEADENLPGDIN